MGKSRTPEELLVRASRLLEGYVRAFKRHTRKRRLLRSKGDKKGERKAKAAAERAEHLSHRWQREIHKIEKQIKTRTLLEQRYLRIRPAETGGSDLECLTDGQRRAKERDERALEARTAEKKKRLSAASVAYDTRIASGARAYETVNLGARMRAFVNHFAESVPRKADRTDTRLLAWQAFDQHYHGTQEGLMAGSRFEPGVDTSTVPGVSEYRLTALRADAEIRQRIGPRQHSLLIEVVYHQRNLQELPGLSGFSPKERIMLLLHALDLAAIYWRLDEVRKVRTRHSTVVILLPMGDRVGGE